MSKATGAQTPSESQRAGALWAMKAAKDRSEEYYDPACKEDSWAEQKLAWSCGNNISETRWWPCQKTFECSENPFTACRCQLLSSQCLSASLVERFCKICGKGTTEKASGLATHIIQPMECPRKCGPQPSFSSSSSERSPSLSRRQ